MTTKRHVAQAVVIVTVELPVGTYGPECTLAEITEQAAREGVNKARNLVGKYGRVIGNPIVRTVTTAEEQGTLG